MRLLLKVCAVALLAVTAACAQERQPDGPLVLAAASLQDALTAASQEWQVRGHAQPVLSFAATSALARQIAAGAPADLFISADEAWMEDVADLAALREGSRVDLLTNTLVLIAPADSSGAVSIASRLDLTGALDGGRLAIADPDSVPAGRYARQALESLDAWDAVADRTVRTDNVRVALSLVARREAALGIVYATDAQAEPGVRVVGTFPSESHAPIAYPMAILATSTNADTADFARFLKSEAGQAIFARFGFAAAEAN